MPRFSRVAAGALGAVLLLAGCGARNASSQTSAGVVTRAAAAQPSNPTPSSSSRPAAPSATAQMVCGPQIQGSVVQALKLTKLVPPKPTWHDSRYSCVYQLPMGPMTLSVQQSASDAAANAYFATLRPTFGKTSSMIGLGTQSYGTDTGIVVVVKDDKTLVVDTTKLPAVFGPEHQKRTDLAYEIASDVLGCWTGNDYGSTVGS